MNRQTDRYLLLKTIRALLAFSLQQAASALRPWVGVGGHNDLVAMAHALVDMVLRIGSGLMGGVRGMGVVLGLVSGLGQSHRQTTAGVGLSRGCMEKNRLVASNSKTKLLK